MLQNQFTQKLILVKAEPNTQVMQVKLMMFQNKKFQSLTESYPAEKFSLV